MRGMERRENLIEDRGVGDGEGGMTELLCLLGLLEGFWSIGPIGFIGALGTVVEY